MGDSHSFDDNVVIPAMQQQLGLFPELEPQDKFFNAEDIDLSEYDRAVLCLSGKDSIASLLHLLDAGFDRDRIELWHHRVDGESENGLMDWTFNDSFIKKFAEAFDMDLYFSWIEGGIEMEMLKENDYSKPQKVETPSGLITLERDLKRAKKNTRLRFPQMSGSLQTRWCSGVAKIDVSRRALANQERFNNSKTVYISGERRLESNMRSKYFQLERHVVDRRDGRLKRKIDHWRPVLNYTEEMVWALMQKHGVVAPVPYRLGWPRSSCFSCVFNSPSIWSTINEYFPDRIKRIADYEDQFGTTISREKINVLEQAKRGTAIKITDSEALQQSMMTEYTLPIFCDPDDWQLPAGAFSKESCGSV